MQSKIQNNQMLSRLEEMMFQSRGSLNINKLTTQVPYWRKNKQSIEGKKNKGTSQNLKLYSTQDINFIHVGDHVL